MSASWQDDFGEYLGRLRMIDPALARQIVESQNRSRFKGASAPKILGGSVPRGDDDNPCEIAAREVAMYKQHVEETISARRRIGYDDVGVGLVTIAILLAAIFFASINGILASLGLTGTTTIGEVQKITTADKSFKKDALALRGTGKKLDMELNKCGKNASCCEKVTDMALEAMKALNDAVSTKSPVG